MLVPTARRAGWSGLVGGLLWAVTPLRQSVFGAGRTPDEGEAFFRSYNVVLVVVGILLTVALLRLRGSSQLGRAAALGWWTMFVGHALLVLGSIPAVLLGGGATTLVMGGQDFGFLGAMIAALGAGVVGLGTLREESIPTLASWLMLLTLPLGAGVTATLTALGTPEDLLGLPLTILYGGAWSVLGWSWIRARARGSGPGSATPSPSGTRQR